MPLLSRLIPLAALLLSGITLLPARATPVSACSTPSVRATDATFDLAAGNLLPKRYPQLPTAVPSIPASLLKAVGWVESGWRQYASSGRPLVSDDFGYGMMQITSGMAGAFGNVDGDLSPADQSLIASDYVYNIAYGARILAAKWAATPRVGAGDPSTIEDWYYALWAYNGWGWFNNPNNPRFSRRGTPASNPSNFPYQERVLYLVSHPPKDADGNPLWPPIPVTLPTPQQVGTHPGPLTLHGPVHTQAPMAFAADYVPFHPGAVAPGAAIRTAVRVVNTGTQEWPAAGPGGFTVGYHVISGAGSPLERSHLSSSLAGSLAFPHTVLPGHSVTLRALVHAPGKIGAYRLVWDIAMGDGTWLSDSGVPSLAVRFAVSMSHPSPTRTPTPRQPEDLRYVADTGIPDGTVLPPGRPFVKGWLVYNDGTEPWGSDWTLKLIHGQQMGERSIPLPLVAPCRSSNIIAGLRAPEKTGRYLSVWRVVDPAGKRVGERLTVSIVVGGPGTSVPTPGPTATATPIPPLIPPLPTPTPVG